MFMDAAMSLMEFIRTTTRDVQEGNRAKTAEGVAAEQRAATASMAAGEGSKAANTKDEEEEEIPLLRKKNKRGSKDTCEDERAQKRRQKERARKSIQVGERLEETARVTEKMPRLDEEERPAAEIEIPVTPSGGLVETTMSSLVEVQDVGESPTEQAHPRLRPLTDRGERSFLRRQC